MRASARRAALLWLVIGLAAACEDPPAVLGPEDGITLTNQPGMFHLKIHDLDNVIQDTNFTWVSNDSTATVIHNSLVTHGYAYLNILDAKGVLVSTSSLVYEADSVTRKGAPGNWTLQFQFKASTGRVDVTVENP